MQFETGTWTLTSRARASSRSPSTEGQRWQPAPACDPLQVSGEPDLEKKDPYVSFDGKTFNIDPADIVNTEYESKLTLPQLIKTAARFAGPEKSGVHKIARKEPKVVDLEIAFTKAGENGDLSAPRVDIAVLVQVKPGKAELVFCEAKCADNPELWGLEKLPKEAKSFVLPSA
ncbi:hypothetical protein [Bradyrhizobium sp. DASA03120]|uniref:hypothetical protein n=1 Tax=Bradyrhizobium sp. SMVTL-02 TaxID=3395917 RepID=UPI003F704B1E